MYILYKLLRFNKSYVHIQVTGLRPNRFNKVTDYYFKSYIN